jgi:glycolate oxidase iron-sulfur subunit
MNTSSGRRPPERIIVLCASGYHMLKEIYPRLVPTKETRQMAERVSEIMQFVQEQQVVLRPMEGLKLSVHDPCHLKASGTWEATRVVLGQITNALSCAGEDACCGGAGAFGFKHDLLSRRIARRRIDALLRCGAAEVATACPGCVLQLSTRLAELELPIKVSHAVQLVDRQLEHGLK